MNEEDLINRNKELEEKVMQKDLEIIGVEEYTKASMREIIEHYYTVNEDCIPKSKIKELLDNKFIVLYEGDAEFPDDVKYINAKYLEELLQEGE